MLKKLFVVTGLMILGGVSPRAQAPAASSAFDLTTPTGVISGTLRLPVETQFLVRNATKYPVVLIIAGSGPTDRNGNGGPQLQGNTYLMLADALAARGIASVRYDKRGIAASRASAPPEADMRLDISVNDASLWIEKLRNDNRFSSVVVAGHSEGSLVGMLAAREARADGFVSIAGAASRLSDVMRAQLKPQLAALPALAAANEAIIASIEAGRVVNPLPPLIANAPAFAGLWRLSVQPYLISEFRFHPAEEFRRLLRPALIIQGTTDIQVSVDEAKALATAKQDSSIKIIDGMNHVLKMAPSDRLANIATYAKPDLPLVTDVPDAIAAYITRLALPPHAHGERKSPRTVTSAVIDGVRIAVEYGQLGVRDRKIWGGIVPWNKQWMPGADEATTLTTSGPIVLGGLTIPAGDHTLFALPSEDNFVLQVSNEIYHFHTDYHASMDLGRVKMSMTKIDPPVELLRFEIVKTATGGTLKFAWADREYAVPFVI